MQNTKEKFELARAAAERIAEEIGEDIAVDRPSSLCFTVWIPGGANLPGMSIEVVEGIAGEGLRLVRVDSGNCPVDDGRFFDDVDELIEKILYFAASAVPGDIAEELAIDRLEELQVDLADELAGNLQLSDMVSECSVTRRLYNYTAWRLDSSTARAALRAGGVYNRDALEAGVSALLDRVERMNPSR